MYFIINVISSIYCLWYSVRSIIITWQDKLFNPAAAAYNQLLYVCFKELWDNRLMFDDQPYLVEIKLKPPGLHAFLVPQPYICTLCPSYVGLLVVLAPLTPLFNPHLAPILHHLWLSSAAPPSSVLITQPALQPLCSGLKKVTHSTIRPITVSYLHESTSPSMLGQKICWNHNGCLPSSVTEKYYFHSGITN